MDLKAFLQAVVPNDGLIITAEHGDGKFRHTLHSTGDYIDAAARCQRVGKRADAYFAMASFRPECRTTRKKRTQDNVKSLQALWLDIDIGPNKPYSDVAAARIGLTNFLKATKLPLPSIIVSSGGGLHLYWVLSAAEAAATGRWQAATRALKRACAANNFHADPAATADSARVLRPPSTFNHKYNQPRPVRTLHPAGNNVVTYSLAQLQQLLKPWGGQIQAAPSLGPVPAVLQQTPDDLNELGEGINVPRIRFARYMVERCPWLADAAANQGAKQDEPSWYNMLCLLSMCEDGEAYATRMSSGHVGYTPNSLATKWEQIKTVDEKQRAILCETIETNCSASQCATCTHRSSIKTPLMLGKPPEEQGFPDGYRLYKGDIERAVEDSGGAQWKPLLAGLNIDKLQLVELPPNGDDELTVIRIHHVANTERAYRDLHTHEVVQSLPAFRTHATRRRVPVGTDAHAIQLRNFLMTWLSSVHAERTKVRELERPTLGWSYHGDRFRTTQNWHTTDGATTTAAGIPDYADAPGKHLDRWKAAAKIITDQDNGGHLVILASAFASPLVRFTGTARAPIVNVHTVHSGVGKTTTMELAQSVWVAPGKALVKLNDTENFILKRLERMKNLPVYWDEGAARGTSKQLREFVLQVSMGSQRGRLNQDATLQYTGQWELMLLACNNFALLDVLNMARSITTAGEARVLDVPMHDAAAITQQQNLLIREACRSHHTLAGDVYAKHLVDNIDRISSSISTMQETLTTRLDLTAADRILCAAMATLLVGAKEANTCGLTAFNINTLATALLEPYGLRRASQQGINSDVSALAILKEYINDTAFDCVRVDYLRSAPNRPRTYYPAPHQNVQRHVSYELAVDESKIRIARTDLRDWLDRKQLRVYGIYGELEKLPYVTSTMAQIGANTPFERPLRQRVLDIDTSHRAFIAYDLSHELDSDCEGQPSNST